MKVFKDSLYCRFLSNLWDALGCKNPNQCSAYVDDILMHISSEAYPNGELAPQCMLSAIHETLMDEYRSLCNTIRQKAKEKDAPADVKETCSRLLTLCKKAAPTQLPRTYEKYIQSLSSLANGGSGSWSKRLKGQFRIAKYFDFIQIWLFEILRPQTVNGKAETSVQKNTRIGKIYRTLVMDYLKPESPDEKLFANHCHFTWQTDNPAPITLSGGTLGLISTVLLLYILLSRDLEKAAWSADDQALIEQFIKKLIKRVDEDNGYISRFNNIQQPSVYIARPYITPEGSKKEPHKAFTPPAVIPWEDFNFATPARVWVQTSAASGKSAMYQAIAQALTGDQPKDLALAATLKLPRDESWVVIGLNAQQYIYNRDLGNICNGICDLFFRGNLILKKVPDAELKHVLEITIPPRLDNAHKNHRLILMLDGVDELTEDMQQSLYLDVTDFFRKYPDAHGILFSRPLSKRYNNAFGSIFSNTFTFGSDNDAVFAYGRYQHLPKTSLMRTLLTGTSQPSMPQKLYDYTSQIISKAYDYEGRKVLLPKELQEQNLQELAERLAWNTAINGNSDVRQELMKFLDLSEADSEQKILTLLHEIALKIGILVPHGDDFRFISEPVHTVLAAAHLTKLLQSNTSPVMIRTALLSLPQEQFQNITFALVHLLPQKSPLFAELLLSDYMFREWNEACAKQALQDLQDMAQGKYGRTPFQQTTGNTLERMLSVAKNTTFSADKENSPGA